MRTFGAFLRQTCPKVPINLQGSRSQGSRDAGQGASGGFFLELLALLALLECRRPAIAVEQVAHPALDPGSNPVVDAARVRDSPKHAGDLPAGLVSVEHPRVDVGASLDRR